MKKRNILIILLIFIFLIPLLINFYLLTKYQNKIINENDITNTYQYALILGCGITKNNKPSKMLKDRLDIAISLYNEGLIQKLIISGSHKENYSEVDVMEEYLLNEGLEQDVIIRDNTGFSTHESIENFKKNYKGEKVIIISQNYHLYRSLYISDKLNIEAIGVPARKINYAGFIYRELREVLARCKDFFLYLKL